MFDLMFKLAKARDAIAKGVDEVVKVEAPQPPVEQPTEPAVAAPEQPDDGGAVFERIDFRGITIEVDRPRGFIQEGVDAAGVAWSRVYHVPYGFIPGTLGGDGEGLDVFIGGDSRAETAFWITQVRADGTFDEFKCMLGFADQESAKAAYTLHIPKRFYGGCVAVPVEHMKAMLGIEPVLTQMVKALGAEQAQHPPAPTRFGSVQIVRAAKATSAGGAKLQYVLGVVLEPDTVDLQGDIYDANVVRQSAWDFMIHFRNVGLQHNGLINGKAHIVDSFVTPEDITIAGKLIRAGTWLMGLHVVDPELWAEIEAGKITGLSIGGFAAKNRVV